MLPLNLHAGYAQLLQQQDGKLGKLHCVQSPVQVWMEKKTQASEQQASSK